jgi:hypothetical protein
MDLAESLRRHLASIGKRLQSWQEENAIWLLKIAFLAIQWITVERIRAKRSYLIDR